MTPADIVKQDTLAEKVCHDEQMDVWAGELIEHLMDHLVDPDCYDDVIALRRAAKAGIRDIVQSAFSHPELLGIEGEV